MRIVCCRKPWFVLSLNYKGIVDRGDWYSIRDGV